MLFRSSVSADAPAKRIEDYVAGWVHGIMATNQVDLLEDLATVPYVVARGQSSIEVVFVARPSSQRWKDWMVYLTRDLQSSIPGITFECFYDLVAEAPHPASVSSGPFSL